MDTNHFTTSFDKLIALWILRLFPDGFISTLIGLRNGFTRDRDNNDNLYLTHLRELLESSDACFSPRVRENFRQFASIFDLDETETKIMEFYACAMVIPELEILNILSPRIRGELNENIAGYLAAVLNLPHSNVSSAFSPDSRLLCNALIFKGEPYEFVSRPLANLLLNGEFCETALLNLYGVEILSVTKETDNLDYLKTGFGILVSYLEKCRTQGKKGINVLLYGNFAYERKLFIQTIAKAFEVPVLEIGFQDPCYNKLNQFSRLNALKATDFLHQNMPIVKIFDHAEHVIGKIDASDYKKFRKLHLKPILETNINPVIWMIDSIDRLSKRFTDSFELKLEIPLTGNMHLDATSPEISGRFFAHDLLCQLSAIDHPAASATVSEVRGSKTSQS